MGFFEKVKKGLNRTVKVLQTDVRDLFKTTGRLVDASFLSELQETLLRTDMGVVAARAVADDIQEQFRGRVVEKDEVLEVVKSSLKALMAQDEPTIRVAEEGPTVIVFCGVNGSGKTTSIAKLTKMLVAASIGSCERRAQSRVKSARSRRRLLRRRHSRSTSNAKELDERTRKD